MQCEYYVDMMRGKIKTVSLEILHKGLLHQIVNINKDTYIFGRHDKI